jgi:hypothetical protein
MLDTQTRVTAQRTSQRKIISGGEALALARQMFPDLSGDGIRLYPGSTPQEIRLDQVETAMVFLKLLRPTRRPTIGSGTLKHDCENWGSANGMSAYVSRGALTAAAVALGYAVTAYRYGPHVAIGVSRRDLSRLNDETCVLRQAQRRERAMIGVNALIR